MLPVKFNCNGRNSLENNFHWLCMWRWSGSLIIKWQGDPRIKTTFWSQIIRYEEEEEEEAAAASTLSRRQVLRAARVARASWLRWAYNRWANKLTNNNRYRHLLRRHLNLLRWESLRKRWGPRKRATTLEQRRPALKVKPRSTTLHRKGSNADIGLPSPASNWRNSRKLSRELIIPTCSPGKSSKTDTRNAVLPK